VTGAGPHAGGLAFKAREIEELADVYFFRPFGILFARLARVLGLSPTGVTLVGTVVGVAGGVLLAAPQRAFAGFVLLVLHGVLDSADGQLARMTGTSSDFGRMMDGFGGYTTHTAIYAGIATAASGRGAGWSLWWIVPLAAVSNVVHAQLYDYHRNTYIAIAVKGAPTRATFGSPHRGLLRLYETMQRIWSGMHPEVERVVAERQCNGRVRDADSRLYRACFYWPVRGWNVLGDNTRFYAIGVLALIGRVDRFFTFVLVPMNMALAVLMVWQSRADRRFLAGV
jgi:hypothetical protein